MVAPYIDFYANKANAFLYKERGIALGGALCPFLFGNDLYTIPITVACCMVLLAAYLLKLKNYLGE
ncbi:MAG TPA: hypothetical protein VK133_03870 [Amoebophilaceae bacterium]|jgi:hypothetical protein|nr:hypothetical protein [Amoebophilaceae bacterium]